MRILLVGEYSGFHNALKYGLESLGHEVTIVGDGDGFKNFPVDIKLYNYDFEKSWFKQKLRVLVYKILKKDLRDVLVLSRFRESENLIKNYDIVQFINSNALKTSAPTERRIIDFLIQNNKASTLVACGDDTPYSEYLIEKHEGYSILNPYKEGFINKKGVYYTLKYLESDYRDNFNFLKTKCSYIIPSNTDYFLPLKDEAKATQIIPAPVQVQKFELTQNKNIEPVEIFMGINRNNYWKKGINYFEKALEIIKNRYHNKVKITIAENLPYSKYIKSYNSCHILLDQVLCYDQGYNALEAMAQGKVVFAGASSLYLEAHGLNNIPVIDARPDVNYLVNELSKLIDQPQDILKLGKQARQHVLDYHDSVKIAKRYLELYTDSLEN